MPLVTLHMNALEEEEGAWCRPERALIGEKKTFVWFGILQSGK